MKSFIIFLCCIATVNGRTLPGLFFGSNQAVNAPQYEGHSPVEFETAAPATSTVLGSVTKTHTLRVPSTSDIWVTSVQMVTVPVTQYSTIRSFVPDTPDTVTSYLRITRTPISVFTVTAAVAPVKTAVSVFTSFVTATQTVELWQPIVHQTTSYEVLTVPVVETQTLVQHLYRTTTVTSYVDVTSVRDKPQRFF